MICSSGLKEESGEWDVLQLYCSDYILTYYYIGHLSIFFPLLIIIRFIDFLMIIIVTRSRRLYCHTTHKHYDNLPYVGIIDFMLWAMLKSALKVVGHIVFNEQDILYIQLSGLCFCDMLVTLLCKVD